LSVLTKVFIVLHVVLTMLFVAATVVWVNRVETFNDPLKTAKADATAANRRAEEAQAAAATAKADATALSIQSATAIGNVRKERDQALATVRERDAALAGANQNVASEGAKLQAVTAALKVAQTSNSSLQQQLEATRAASDKLQQENTQLLTANADLNSRQQVALRQNRALSEDLDQLRNQLADLQAGGGGGRAAAAVPAGSTQAAGVRTEQAINGVVRDVKNVGGVNTATISVGSVDNVKPQMQFNVIDREAGNFLGYFVVDRVEQNESVGRLTGPHVDQMKKGNEVRTQL
jgi:hypothetical protein